MNIPNPSEAFIKIVEYNILFGLYPKSCISLFEKIKIYGVLEFTKIMTLFWGSSSGEISLTSLTIAARVKASLAHAY